MYALYLRLFVAFAPPGLKLLLLAAVPAATSPAGSIAIATGATAATAAVAAAATMGSSFGIKFVVVLVAAGCKGEVRC